MRYSYLHRHINRIEHSLLNKVNFDSEMARQLCVCDRHLRYRVVSTDPTYLDNERVSTIVML